MDESSGLIYLVRHCATTNDAANYPVLLGQQSDCGLSAVGEEQAQKLSRYFAGKELSAAYCSPQRQAVRTAQLICANHDVPLTFCPSLSEADVGRWEGLPYNEIIQTDNERFGRFIVDPGAAGYPGGENLSEVCQRALPILRRICQLYPHGRVLVVSHKQTIRAVLTELQLLPFNRARELDQDPGGINLIRIFRGEMELKAVNWADSFSSLEEEEDHAVLHQV